MSQKPPCISVEVAYATVNEQVIVRLQASPGITAGEAIHRSGIQKHFTEIDLTRQKIGIFSRLVELTQPLRHQDRVEIYRPLIADPKEMRRWRAARNNGRRRDSSARG